MFWMTWTPPTVDDGGVLRDRESKVRYLGAGVKGLSSVLELLSSVGHSSKDI